MLVDFYDSVLFRIDNKKLCLNIMDLRSSNILFMGDKYFCICLIMDVPLLSSFNLWQLLAFVRLTKKVVDRSR